MRYARVISGTPKTSEDLKDPKRVAAGKKGGRPNKGRINNIQIKVSREEREFLNRVSSEQGITVSDLFRKMLLLPETESENTIPIIFKNQPCYLTEAQAKDLYRQLTKVLIGD